VQLGAVALDRRELGFHRARGHDHVGGNAAGVCGQGERRPVVAGRVRDHAARGSVRIQRPHRVAGAAELERPGALQVFALEEELGARQRVERARAQQRRDVGMRGNARSGILHVGEGGH